jgi:hypothetical protein
LPEGRYNIVLLGRRNRTGLVAAAEPEGFSGRRAIPCPLRKASTATRLHRIAEVERLEEADDPAESVERVRQHAQAVSLFSELMSRLTSIGGFLTVDYVGDRATIPNPLDKIKNAVLIDSIANTFNFTAKKNRLCWNKVGVVRLERLCVLFRFALAGRDRVRVPDSGSLHRFIDAIKIRRYSQNKPIKLRFQEIQFVSISTRDTLRRGANEPEGRPRSTWNGIVIPIANTGFPSVSKCFNLTLISVDETDSIGASGHCEKPRKLINCAQRWDETLEIPGTIVT